ncbi:MAG TPA: hypothetical protein PK990_06400 [Salinivirgaceae bacterium]|nr:hypothetical protein [Salinivirgaceae bacterium]
MNSENSKKGTVQDILIIILSVLTIGLGILYFMEKKKNIQQVEVNVELTNTKDSLETRLEQMIEEYDNLKTNNEQIRVQLLAEKEKVKDLLTRLRNERDYSRAKIAEYEKELGTLRKIMRSYIVQIDSLNQSNVALRAENKQVKQKIKAIETEREEISKKLEEASEKVDQASVLRPINIEAQTFNHRGKEVSRARNVEKIKVCFTLDQNPIAKPGNRFIYVQITGPEGIIPNAEQDSVLVDGEKYLYSAKREVDYQNQSIDVCLFVDVTGELTKGIYKIELFADKRHIGTGSFTLK